jgi:hypothetical protein
MRALLALVAIAAVSVVKATESTHVDGVPVSGTLNQVEVRDIRAAIGIAKSHASVSKVVVLGRADMNIYLRPSDLGYLQLGRVGGATPEWRQSHDWYMEGPNIYDPQVISVIKRADAAYVFPIATPEKPRRDDTRMREVVGVARRDLTRLLGDQRNWYKGLYTAVMLPERRSIGVMFRHGSHQVVLFFRNGGFAQGTYDGQYIVDLLEDGKNIDQWARRHASDLVVAK